MNNNPNNNRPDGRPARPRNADPRQQSMRPDMQRRSGGNGRQPMRSEGYRNSDRPIHNSDVRQNPQPRQNGSTFTRVALIWIAVLAVILVVILITAGLRNEKDDGSVPADAGTVITTEGTTTTEETTTFPVDYADYTDQTKTFSADLDFANGILIDVEKGEVVASRGGDARIYPASMTKIMTLIVAAEAVEDLDETFTMTAEITDPLYLANASVAGFLVGEQVTVRDLIYGLILPSGGDGALGLAYHIAGSEEAFAELMNKKAAELGLKNTHFTNCTGLHNVNHYSTCHEIAMILEYAIKDPFMKEVLTTYRYTTEITPEHPEGIELISTMLSRMEGNESGTMFVQGGKTGYTIEAKNCLASFATPLIPSMSEDQLKLQPTKYILVTAGSGEKFGPVFDAIDVYRSFSEDTPAETADAAVTASPAETEPEETTDTSPDIFTAKVDKPAETRPAETGSVKIYTAAPPS